MKFTTSSTRRIGSVLVYGVAAMVKNRDMVRNCPKYLKSFVPPEISMHRMKLFTLFTSAILFLSRRLENVLFVLMQPEKTLKKVKLWRTGAWLSVEGYSVEPPEREIHKIFDQSPPCWMPKIFDEWSILPKQVDCFFRDARSRR